MSWIEHWIYLELNLKKNSKCNLGRLQRRLQTKKAWLGTHLDYIISIRFGVGGINKKATEYKKSMSNQLTVFFSRAFVMVYKDWHFKKIIWW